MLKFCSPPGQCILREIIHSQPYLMLRIGMSTNNYSPRYVVFGMTDVQKDATATEFM